MPDYKINFSFADRVAVVTGAAQGIGQAIAVGFAHAGANVALIDLTEESLAETEELIKETGVRSLRAACDVGDEAAVIQTFAKIKEQLGPVNVLANAAGVLCENTTAEDALETDMDRLWRVNLKGTFFTSRAAMRQMSTNGGGSIVNLASQASLVSLPDQSVYTATKGAVSAVTRSFAIDWAKHRITVNAIAPTFIKTKMAAAMLEQEHVSTAALRRIPLGRFGLPQDVAGAALFLTSDAASLITGHTLPVDGGWTAGEPDLF